MWTWRAGGEGEEAKAGGDLDASDPNAFVWLV